MSATALNRVQTRDTESDIDDLSRLAWIDLEAQSEHYVVMERRLANRTHLR